MRGDKCICHLSSLRLSSAEIGTSSLSGCRGVIGSVPQPLWMSISFKLLAIYIIMERDCQIQDVGS